MLVRLVLSLLDLGLDARLLALCEVALLVCLRLRLPLELLLLAQVLPPLRQQLEHVGRLRLRVGLLHGGPLGVACRSRGASVKRCSRQEVQASSGAAVKRCSRQEVQPLPLRRLEEPARLRHATTLPRCRAAVAALCVRRGGLGLGASTRRAERHRPSQRRRGCTCHLAAPRQSRRASLGGLWATLGGCGGELRRS